MAFQWARSRKPGFGSLSHATPLGATGEHDVETIIKFSEQVADEDARVCEHVQRNLNSGNYDVGVLSPKWEEGIRVFHELVREAVGPLD